MNRTAPYPGAARANAGPAADWPLAIPEHRRRWIRLWLWSIAAMTFAVVVVGGITRLTLSGLSIVDWQPLMGVIPPLSEEQWQHAFDQYRQFPEFLTWRSRMTLAEFKFIYFWEYLHRLLARSIGIVFLLPFLFFVARRWFNRPLLKRSLLLFALGAAQGVMGWIMVKSGLVDRPSVSHYRLAAHLVLAFMIFSGAVWLARDLALRDRRPPLAADQRRRVVSGLAAVGILLAAQIVWGAFVAGLKAGKYYPTFPLMGGRLVPPDLLWLDPAAANFIANPIAVQWVHRLLGTLLLAAVLALFVVVRRRATDPATRGFNAAFAALIVIQFALGVLTLVLRVPVALGVLHQATALVTLGVWLIWLHHVSRCGAAMCAGRDGAAAVPGLAGVPRS